MLKQIDTNLCQSILDQGLFVQDKFAILQLRQRSIEALSISDQQILFKIELNEPILYAHSHQTSQEKLRILIVLEGKIKVYDYETLIFEHAIRNDIWTFQRHQNNVLIGDGKQVFRIDLQEETIKLDFMKINLIQDQLKNS